jgi:hypothetical protein
VRINIFSSGFLCRLYFISVSSRISTGCAPILSLTLWSCLISPKTVVSRGAGGECCSRFGFGDDGITGLEEAGGSGGGDDEGKDDEGDGDDDGSGGGDDEEDEECAATIGLCACFGGASSCVEELILAVLAAEVVDLTGITGGEEECAAGREGGATGGEGREDKEAGGVGDPVFTEDCAFSKSFFRTSPEAGG